MTETINFKACKHLDYSDNYSGCTKEIMGEGYVFWFRREVPEEYPQFVQFCKLRGRLNNPECCIGCESKQCSDYEEVEHSIEFRTVEGEENAGN